MNALFSSGTLRYVSRGLPGLVGGALLVYLLHRAGWGSLWGLVSRVAFFPLLLACCVGLANLLLASFRFKGLVDAPLGFASALEVYLTGYVFNYASVMPGLGSGVKTGLLWKRRVGLSRALAGVGGEVVLGAAFCMVVGISFLVTHPDLVDPRRGRAGWVVPVCAAAGFILIGLVWLVFRKQLRTRVQPMLDAAGYLWRAHVIWRGLVLTVISWSCTALTAWLLFLSLGDKLPFPDLFGGICLGYLGGLLSLIPAGLGVREGLWAYLFMQSGLGFSACMLVAVCVRVLYLFLALFLWTVLRITLRRTERVHENTKTFHEG